MNGNMDNFKYKITEESNNKYVYFDENSGTEIIVYAPNYETAEKRIKEKLKKENKWTI